MLRAQNSLICAPVSRLHCAKLDAHGIDAFGQQRITRTPGPAQYGEATTRRPYGSEWWTDGKAQWFGRTKRITRPHRDARVELHCIGSVLPRTAEYDDVIGPHFDGGAGQRRLNANRAGR